MRVVYPRVELLSSRHISNIIINDADLLLLLRQCGYANLLSLLEQPAACMWDCFGCDLPVDNDRWPLDVDGPSLLLMMLYWDIVLRCIEMVWLTQQYRCGVILSTLNCNACITLSFVRFSDVSGNKKNKKIALTSINIFFIVFMLWCCSFDMLRYIHHETICLFGYLAGTPGFVVLCLQRRWPPILN